MFRSLSCDVRVSEKPVVIARTDPVECKGTLGPKVWKKTVKGSLYRY